MLLVDGGKIPKGYKDKKAMLGDIKVKIKVKISLPTCTGIAAFFGAHKKANKQNRWVFINH